MTRASADLLQAYFFLLDFAHTEYFTISCKPGGMRFEAHTTEQEEKAADTLFRLDGMLAGGESGPTLELTISTSGRIVKAAPGRINDKRNEVTLELHDGKTTQLLKLLEISDLR